MFSINSFVLFVSFLCLAPTYVNSQLTCQSGTEYVVNSAFVSLNLQNSVTAMTCPTGFDDCLRVDVIGTYSVVQIAGTLSMCFNSSIGNGGATYCQANQNAAVAALASQGISVSVTGCCAATCQSNNCNTATAVSLSSEGNCNGQVTQGSDTVFSSTIPISGATPVGWNMSFIMISTMLGSLLATIILN